MTTTYSPNSVMIEESNGSQSRRKGCFITPVKGLIIVLAAIALAVIVGLIVGMEHPDRGKKCQVSTTGSQKTGSSTSGSPSEPQVEIRLPDTLIPTHYDLRLRPDIYGTDPANFKSTGSVDIFLTCVKPTKVITLHVRDLQIDQDQVTIQKIGNGAAVQISSFSEEKEIVEFFKIHLRKNLEQDAQYKITFGRFSGAIKDDLKGIYYSSYLDEGNIKYLLTSQLQATDGRKVFPCMDEPHLKATFNVTLERKVSSGYRAMSNMDIYKTEPLEADWEASHFGRTPVMSVYLLAFMMSDFQCVTNRTTDGLQVHVCSRHNAFDQTAFTSTIAAPIQDWFADYHHIPFPLEKNTHIAVPDFSAGAMENWGLIIYRETALLFDPASSTSAQRERVVTVVAHELAHMWFGNLVTTKWWDDIWLNEGFASYMSGRGVDSQFPQWNSDADFILHRTHRVFALDALPTSHPVFLEVKDPSKINEIFDQITYSKGSSVIRMMRNFLGEETFRNGLSNYLKDRKYKDATHQALFQFLTEQASDDGKDIDVHAVMNTWILQMGYPVVTFSFDRGAGKISLAQEHFLLDPSSRSRVPPSDFNYIWKVPITFATNKDSTSLWNEPDITWLNAASGEISGVPTDARWIIGNLNQAFYYRNNYDRATWTALQNQLKTDHEAISVNSRCQLIDDAFNLGRAGIIEQTVALEISNYLSNEEDYFPWKAFSRNIEYLSQMLVVTGAYGYLQRYVQNAVKEVYEDSLWDKTTLDPITQHTLRLRRTLILNLACHYGHEGCANKAYEQFQNWMTLNTTNPIEEDLRPVVYCTGLAMGGQAEWEFVFRKLANSNSGAESKNLIKALGCTKQDWLLRRYMEEAVAERPPVRRQNFRDVISSVAGNSIGRKIAWETFVENYDILFERFGATSFTFTNIVDAITLRMSTKYEYHLVESFKNSENDLGTAATAFSQALDKIKVNIAWKQKQENVVTWLKNNM